MKIEDRNKKLFMSRWLARTGKGVKRKYDKHISQKALDYMHSKPYGGVYSHEQKHSDTGEQQQVSADATA